MYRGQDPVPACTGAWVDRARGGTEPQHGACDCGCEITNDAEIAAAACDDVTWSVSWSASPNCQPPTTTAANLFADDCNDVDTQAMASLRATPSGAPDTTACIATQPDPGPVRYTERVGLCATADDLDLCAPLEPPQGYGTAVCVAQTTPVQGGTAPPGVTCPDGYGEPSHVATRVTDGTACNCGCSTDDVRCDGVVELSNNFCTPGSPVTSAPAIGVCQPIQPGGLYDVILVSYTQLAGTCVNLFDPEPDLRVDEWVTVCCRTP